MMPSGTREENDVDVDKPFILGDAEVLAESKNEKNLLFNVDGEEMWIPKKVIHDDSTVWEKGQPAGELVVKLWWAEKNGYV